jgi:hypothetical protein
MKLHSMQQRDTSGKPPLADALAEQFPWLWLHAAAGADTVC